MRNRQDNSFEMLLILVCMYCAWIIFLESYETDDQYSRRMHVQDSIQWADNVRFEVWLDSLHAAQANEMNLENLKNDTINSKHLNIYK